jgi:protein-disulfide isomerase
MPKLAVPLTANDHSMGPADAALTLLYYGDLQCPQCGLLYPRVMEIAHELRDSLRLVYRHFPLADVHPHAERAAEAAEAAASQERLWELVPLLYANQDRLDDDSLVRYAKKANLDVRRFRKDLASGVHGPRVRSDYLGGVRSGVKGTPTIFINGDLYEGAFQFDALVAALLKASRHQQP